MSDQAGVVRAVVENLGAVFRHLVPGVLIMVAAAVSHPSWPCWSLVGSTRGVVLLAVIAVAVGNAWYVVNRYVFHQVIDLVLYVAKLPGPARQKPFRYHDHLATWVSKALAGRQDARHHVAFRAASVFLVYTVGQLLVLMATYYEPDSVPAAHRFEFVAVGVLLLLLGIWQNIITRRIDAVLLHGHQPE